MSACYEFDTHMKCLLRAVYGTESSLVTAGDKRSL